MHGTHLRGVRASKSQFSELISSPAINRKLHLARGIFPYLFYKSSFIPESPNITGRQSLHCPLITPNKKAHLVIVSRVKSHRESGVGEAVTLYLASTILYIKGN